MLATLKPWQKTLLDAAEIIKERGLRKGDFGCIGDTHCTLGAIAEAAGMPIQHAYSSTIPPYDVHHIMDPGDGVVTALFDEAHRRILEAVDGNPLFKWNDAPERTAEEVIAALQAAALT